MSLSVYYGRKTLHNDNCDMELLFVSESIVFQGIFHIQIKLKIRHGNFVQCFISVIKNHPWMGQSLYYNFYLGNHHGLCNFIHFLRTSDYEGDIYPCFGGNPFSLPRTMYLPPFSIFRSWNVFPLRFRQLNSSSFPMSAQQAWVVMLGHMFLLASINTKRLTSIVNNESCFYSTLTWLNGGSLVKMSVVLPTWPLRLRLFSLLRYFSSSFEKFSVLLYPLMAYIPRMFSPWVLLLIYWWYQDKENGVLFQKSRKIEIYSFQHLLAK